MILNKLPRLGILTSILLFVVIGCSTSTDVTPIPSIPASTSIPTTAPPTITPTPTASINRIDFVYFHPKIRCALCLNIEVRTKDFLEQRFTSQMQNGEITFTSYELEDKNNAALLKKYGAMSSQLFVNTIVEGQENIQHIEKIWLPSIYNDGVAFDNFLSEIVNNSLEAIR